MRSLENISLVSLSTLVVWCSILTAGLIGAYFPSPFCNRPANKSLPVAHAEVLQVELTDKAISTPTQAAPSSVIDAPKPVVKVRDVPPVPAVAEPSPAIAFALPIKGPVQIVEQKAATYFQPAAQPKTDAVVPIGNSGAKAAGDNALGANAQHLVWGRGEGKQPAPEYPRRAVLEGQEGVVVVRFTVAESGKVLAADPIKASPWRLLNESAVRTILERWRFKPGQVRLYEVSIRFQLEN